MQSRPENGPFSRLSVAQVILGGTVALWVLAIIMVSMERGEPEPPPPPSFSSTTHAPMPVIDAMVMGDSSIAVTNLRGWTGEQVRTYLSALKQARARNALASVGIPIPSTNTGYERGIVYLIDGHPTPDLLGQFVRKEPPGYALIAPAVRGTYRWPPDHLTIGYLDEPLRN